MACASGSFSGSGTWTNRWVGTWKQQSARLVLSLVLDHRDCTRVKTADGTPPEQLACDAVDGKLALSCTTETIAVGEAPVTKLASWRCTPVGAAELADTPMPWTFGRTSCVRTLQGHGGLHYERC